MGCLGCLNIYGDCFNQITSSASPFEEKPCTSVVIATPAVATVKADNRKSQVNGCRLGHVVQCYVVRIQLCMQTTSGNDHRHQYVFHLDLDRVSVGLKDGRN